MKHHIIGRAATLALSAAALFPAGTLPAQGAEPTDDNLLAVYRIGPGDVLSMKFGYNPDMDDSTTVRPDGMIACRLIGEVPAQGKTPAELSALLSSKYQEFFRHPAVTVGLTESANLQAFVGGEVSNPGVVPLDGKVTALRALLFVGGAKSSAKLSDAILIRNQGENQASVRKLNLKAIIQGKEPDFQLLPYDVLYLSRSKIAKANLVVDKFVNGLIPRNLIFPYNLNTNFRVE